MRFLEEAARLIRDAQSKRKAEERGRLDLQRREVEALERIADRCSKPHADDIGKT